jgi:isoleucyl-tRNA synthetase
MSTKFTEYKGLDLPTVASEVLDFEKKTYLRKCNYREGNNFRIFEGPPRQMDYHHVMARAIKDIFADINTKRDSKLRKAGWDTHGLPVELGTEKELGITKKI